MFQISHSVDFVSNKHRTMVSNRLSCLVHVDYFFMTVLLAMFKIGTLYYTAESVKHKAHGPKAAH